MSKVRLKFGPVEIWSPGNGSGYRARCCVMFCQWRDGDRKHGDYVWNVKQRAHRHILLKHERRKGRDRRSPP